MEQWGPGSPRMVSTGAVRNCLGYQRNRHSVDEVDGANWPSDLLDGETQRPVSSLPRSHAGPPYPRSIYVGPGIPICT